MSHTNHECILERSDWLKVRVAVILKVKLPVTLQNLKTKHIQIDKGMLKYSFLVNTVFDLDSAFICEVLTIVSQSTVNVTKHSWGGGGVTIHGVGGRGGRCKTVHFRFRNLEI